jgi:hypothetical protein
MSEVTRVLSAIEHGAPQAAGQLLPLVYGAYRAFAAAPLPSGPAAGPARPRPLPTRQSRPG